MFELLLTAADAAMAKDAPTPPLTELRFCQIIRDLKSGIE